MFLFVADFLVLAFEVAGVEIQGGVPTVVAVLEFHQLVMQLG